MKIVEIFNEQYYQTISYQITKTRPIIDVELFKNPSRKEVAELLHNGLHSVRGLILKNDDVVIWDASKAIHQTMMFRLKVDPKATFIFDNNTIAIWPYWDYDYNRDSEEYQAELFRNINMKYCLENKKVTIE